MQSSKSMSAQTKGVNFNTLKQTPRGEALQDVGHYDGQFVFLKKDG